MTAVADGQAHWSGRILTGAWTDAAAQTEVLRRATGEVMASATRARWTAPSGSRRACDAGRLHINEMTINEAAAPFGGVAGARSGSHFGAVANPDPFTEWQWRTARPVAAPFPL